MRLHRDRVEHLKFGRGRHVTLAAVKRCVNLQFFLPSLAISAKKAVVNKFYFFRTI